MGKNCTDYYFDFSDPPKTDHPKYNGRLKLGLHNVVTLDGVKQVGVLRCMTGACGWIIVKRFNSDKNRTEEVMDSGDVEYLETRSRPKPKRRQVVS